MWLHGQSEPHRRYRHALAAAVSAARPKVADYPFTTLVPNLGVCQLDFRTTVFADIPGASRVPLVTEMMRRGRAAPARR